MADFITQKELLKQTGLSYRQLKYWEKNGIIQAPVNHEFYGWREGQDAIYDTEALDRINAIQKYHYSSITKTWGIEGLFHLLYIECFSFPELYEKEKEIIRKSLDSVIIKEMRNSLRKEKNLQGFVDKSKAIEAVVSNVLSKYIPPNEREILPQINNEIKRVGLAKILGESQVNLKEDIMNIPDEAFVFSEMIEPIMKLLNDNGYYFSDHERLELEEEIAEAGKYIISKLPNNYKWRGILENITPKNLKQLQIILQFYPSQELIWRPEAASTLLGIYIALKMPVPMKNSIPTQDLSVDLFDLALLMLRKLKIGKADEAIKIITAESSQITAEEKDIIFNLCSNLYSIGIISEDIINLIGVI